MNHEKSIIIVALNLKIKWEGQIYVIVKIHTYLLVEL